MIPFDGDFAQAVILPLAVAAYSSTWAPPAGSALASLTSIREILVDTDNDSNPDFQQMLARPRISINSRHTLNTMRSPANATQKPTALDISQAISGAAAAASNPPTTLTATQLTPAASTPLSDHFGWVCLDGKRLIITFRGTHTVGDWLHNLDFIGEPYLPVPGRGTVHQGFQLAYYAVRQNLLTIVKELGAGCTELLIVGHSLGGALATLAMPDILNALPPEAHVSPILYNLASPRVGHDDFQNFFDAHVNICYRVANTWDVVPHVPPALAGYVHVGNQLTIDSGFNLDVAYNHVLSTGYTPGLSSWNGSHPTIQTAHFGSFAVSTMVGVSA